EQRVVPRQRQPDPDETGEMAAAAKELEHRAGFRPPRSEPPGGMQRGDAAGQIAELDPLEPGRRNQLREFALRRKSPDALDEIGIGVAVARDDLAEPWQELKAVEIVEGLQERCYRRGEFEAQKPPARLQHAARLGECALDPRHVA